MRFLFLILICSGCGFLDENILLDDEAYFENEQYLELGEMSFRSHSVQRPRVRGSGGYSSYSIGHRYYSGYAHLPGRRARSLAMRPGKKNPQKDNKEKSAEEKNAVDARSAFIAIINNYGAKAHDLEENL